MYVIHDHYYQLYFIFIFNKFIFILIYPFLIFIFKIIYYYVQFHFNQKNFINMSMEFL